MGIHPVGLPKFLGSKLPISMVDFNPKTYPLTTFRVLETSLFTINRELQSGLVKASLPGHGVLQSLRARLLDTFDQTSMALHLEPNGSRIAIEQNLLSSRFEKIANFHFPLK